MRIKYFIAIIQLLLCISFTAVSEAQNEPRASVQLTQENVFFVVPRERLKSPGPENQVVICLDLPFLETKYPLGFVNMLDESNPALEEGSRQAVTDEVQLKKIHDRAGVKEGDVFSIVTISRDVYPATVKSFEYISLDQSSVIVAALAEIKSDQKDTDLLKFPGIAVKGRLRVNKQSGITIQKNKAIGDKLKDRLLGIAGEKMPKNYVMTEYRIIPAWIESNDQNSYFISAWIKPLTGEEIDQLKIAGWLIREKERQLVNVQLPAAVDVKAVFDLDNDDRAEIFGIVGDGAEICHLLMSYKGTEIKIIRQGLCIGY